MVHHERRRKLHAVAIFNQRNLSSGSQLQEVSQMQYDGYAAQWARHAPNRAADTQQPLLRLHHGGAAATKDGVLHGDNPTINLSELTVEHTGLILVKCLFWVIIILVWWFEASLKDICEQQIYNHLQTKLGQTCLKTTNQYSQASSNPSQTFFLQTTTATKRKALKPYWMPPSVRSMPKQSQRCMTRMFSCIMGSKKKYLGVVKCEHWDIR